MTADFGYQREVTARKARKCEACGKQINVGEKYAYFAGKSEGVFYTLSYHPSCRDWEVKANYHARTSPADDWTPLHELIAEDRAYLIGAPKDVSARFSEACR